MTSYKKAEDGRKRRKTSKNNARYNSRDYSHIGLLIMILPIDPAKELNSTCWKTAAVLAAQK